MWCCIYTLAPKQKEGKETKGCFYASLFQYVISLWTSYKISYQQSLIFSSQR